MILCCFSFNIYSCVNTGNECAEVSECCDDGDVECKYIGHFGVDSNRCCIPIGQGCIKEQTCCGDTRCDVVDRICKVNPTPLPTASPTTKEPTPNPSPQPTLRPTKGPTDQLCNTHSLYFYLQIHIMR